MAFMKELRTEENRMKRYGLDSFGSGYAPVAGSFDGCNEPSGFI
jgi:hypothetical protein